MRRVHKCKQSACRSAQKVDPTPHPLFRCIENNNNNFPICKDLIFIFFSKRVFVELRLPSNKIMCR